MVVHVARHRSAQVRQTLGKADQPVEFRLLLLCAEVRVIQVLLPAGSVDSRRLQIAEALAAIHTSFQPEG